MDVFYLGHDKAACKQVFGIIILCLWQSDKRTDSCITTTQTLWKSVKLSECNWCLFSLAEKTFNTCNESYSVLESLACDIAKRGTLLYSWAWLHDSVPDQPSAKVAPVECQLATMALKIKGELTRHKLSLGRHCIWDELHETGGLSVTSAARHICWDVVVQPGPEVCVTNLPVIHFRHRPSERQPRKPIKAKSCCVLTWAGTLFQIHLL